MSWGHATSENLTDWTEQPVAIACDEREAIFSGSASCWTRPTQQRTSARRTTGRLWPSTPAPTRAPSPLQRAARRSPWPTALDGGATWTKYVGQPRARTAASADFRDPKVFRYDGGAGWLLGDGGRGSARTGKLSSTSPKT